MGGSEEEGAGLFSVVPSNKTRGNGHTIQNQEIQPEHKNTLFCFEGYQALAEVSQRSCGVTITGDTQNLMGHSPGQLSE